jgi:hypothetical protein
VLGLDTNVEAGEARNLRLGREATATFDRKAASWQGP